MTEKRCRCSHREATHSAAGRCFAQSGMVRCMCSVYEDHAEYLALLERS